MISKLRVSSSSNLFGDAAATWPKNKLDAETELLNASASATRPRIEVIAWFEK